MQQVWYTHRKTWKPWLRNRFNAIIYQLNDAATIQTPHLSPFFYPCISQWTLSSLGHFIVTNAMTGPEPELHGFARMVGNGVWGPSSRRTTLWNLNHIQPNLYQFPQSHFGHKGPKTELCRTPTVAMGAKRTCPFEEELRDLLTYTCPYSGKRRCPPLYKGNIKFHILLQWWYFLFALFSP